MALRVGAGMLVGLVAVTVTREEVSTSLRMMMFFVFIFSLSEGESGEGWPGKGGNHNSVLRRFAFRRRCGCVPLRILDVEPRANSTAQGRLQLDLRIPAGHFRRAGRGGEDVIRGQLQVRAGGKRSAERSTRGRLTAKGVDGMRKPWEDVAAHERRRRVRHIAGASYVGPSIAIQYHARITRDISIQLHADQHVRTGAREDTVSRSQRPTRAPAGAGVEHRGPGPAR